MSQELLEAIYKLLGQGSDARKTILLDLLWKMARSDWHGVMDCAADLRELHL